MEFTKNDASSSAKLGKGKRTQVHKSRRLLEKRSRQLMEQSALPKHDIDTFKSELATVGIHDDLTGVAHVRMLPEELLERIFARLPLPDIIRLRVLSKTWDRYVTGVTPGFTKLCAEQNPNLFALVSEGSKYDGDNEPGNGPRVIKLYDSKENRWHEFVHKTCDTMFAGNGGLFAGNGGLLCAVSTAPDKEMEIVVFNPLTKQGRELPSSSSLSRIQPRLVQLVMDRDSKCYKVLVVSKKERGGDAVARIFSSLTGKWSKPNIFSDLIFYCHYVGNDIYGHEEKRDPWASDCASNAFLELADGSYPGRLCGICILAKDRLFVLLRNQNHKYLLKEYQAQNCHPHWVQVKVHNCYELDAYQQNMMLMTPLWGCPGFLVVNACGGYSEDYAHKQTLLFDLSTSQWQTISKIPNCWPIDAAAQMFELQWDAVA